MNLYARRRASLAGVLVLALATLLLPLSPHASATSTTVTFNYTGAAQSWTVPAGVETVLLDAAGAAGGSCETTMQGGKQGGKGGRSQRVIEVIHGEILVVFVGGAGQYSPGFNGGGQGVGRGGGASDVRQGGGSLANRVIVAGGGGGCGFHAGGDGGGVIGESGTESAAAVPATGGTSLGGGTGGLSSWNVGTLQGSPGALGVGGSGSNMGGGGGGGYYGGGGGAAGGGAGGSGYAPDGETQSGVREGDGLVTITYSSNGPCSDSATRVDRIFGVQNGYEYEADIHNTSTDVTVCSTLTSPGGATIFYRELVVAKDTDPTDYLPPYDPPEVDGDAPPGDEAGSPCPVTHSNHGTQNARGYVRQSDSSSEDTIICVGFRLPGAQRHIRVTVHEAPTI